MIDYEPFLISGIAHFVHCPRRWWLINVEGQWAENAYTARGRVFHETVHNPDSGRIRNGVESIRGLKVWSDRLGIEGVCDAVEFSVDANGVAITGKRGLWSVRPVEYKSGGRLSESDSLQLVAQTVCLEEMFKCTVDRGFLYYGKTHERREIRMTDALKTKLEGIVGRMSEIFSIGHAPAPKMSVGCRGCSLHDICMPGEESSVSKYMNANFMRDDI